MPSFITNSKGTDVYKTNGNVRCYMYIDISDDKCIRMSQIHFSRGNVSLKRVMISLAFCFESDRAFVDGNATFKYESYTGCMCH